MVNVGKYKLSNFSKSENYSCVRKRKTESGMYAFNDWNSSLFILDKIYPLHTHHCKTTRCTSVSSSEKVPW
jgi:hypothetical protein